MAGRSSSKSHYQLNDRTFHNTAIIGDSLYVWAGGQKILPKVHDNEEKRVLTSTVERFAFATGKWYTHSTTGTPPLGVWGYSCRAIDNKLFYFGGECGHDNCYHNSVNQLNTTSLEWTQLAPTDPDIPVMRRANGVMITIHWDGVYHLLIIGGHGATPTTKLPQMEYMKLSKSKWRTNEHSLFNTSSRKWSNPIRIAGQCIPPISYSVLEQISNSRAILFGGGINDDTAINSIYILDISDNIVHWQSMKSPHSFDQWPMGRIGHAGTIISVSASPILITMGGMNERALLQKCWFFDITLQSWTQVPLPSSISRRFGHSLSAHMMGPQCVWLVVVGGEIPYVNGLVTLNYPDNTILVELVHKNGQWTVGEIPWDSTKLSTKAYQHKYIHQLQLGRKQWVEEFQQYQKPLQEKEIDLIKNVSQLKEKYQQKEKDTNQLIVKKERQLLRTQEMMRVIIQSYQDSHCQLMKKDKLLLDKDKQILQTQETLRIFLQSQKDKNLLLEGNGKTSPPQDKTPPPSQLMSYRKEKDSHIANLTRRLHSESRKESGQVTFTKDDISKLSVILQSVKDEWYLLGETLDVNKTLLDEIKKKGEGLECLLYTWCKEGERTLTELEKGLKMIGKKELLPGLHNLNYSSFDKQKQPTVTESLSVQLQLIDNLRNVYFAGNDLFIIQGERPQLINWEQYGLRISVKEGTVFPHSTVKISVIALVGGQFVFPKNTKLVSAVYAISVSKEPLLQPLQLEIQHCVNLTKRDQIKYLKFAIAPLSTPYQFSVFKGQFTIGSYYGLISRKEFCLVCIVGEMYKPPVYIEDEEDSSTEEGSPAESDTESISSSNSSDTKNSPPGTSDLQEQETDEEQRLEKLTEENEEENKGSTDTPNIPDSVSVSSHVPLATNRAPNGNSTISPQSTGVVEGMTYAGLVYYMCDGMVDLVTFTAAKYLNVLIQYVRKEYSHAEIGQDVYFTFKEMNGFVELKFGEPQKKPCSGWTVNPHLEPSRLYQDVIDNFGTNDFPAPTKCLISVYGSPTDTTVPMLHYGIPLEGVVNPVTIFINRILRINSSIAGPNLSSASVSMTEMKRNVTTTVSSNPCDVFKKKIPNICKCLASTNYLSFTQQLFSKDLITFDFFKAVTSSDTNHTLDQKANKVVIELFTQLQTSQNPKEKLSTICDILIAQQDPQLKDIGLSMRM